MVTETRRRHTPHAPMARPPLKNVVWSVVGAGLAIFATALIGEKFMDGVDQPYIIGAFGASAVLLFGAQNSPLAQPYNLVVGHLLSALIGVTAYRLVGEANAVSMAAAVAFSIGAMQLTRSLHPPGGATALIAVIGGDPVHALGYLYVVEPVGLGVIVLLVTALIANNIGRGSRWPVFWIPAKTAEKPNLVSPQEGFPQER